MLHFFLAGVVTRSVTLSFISYFCACGGVVCACTKSFSHWNASRTIQTNVYAINISLMPLRFCTSAFDSFAFFFLRTTPFICPKWKSVHRLLIYPPVVLRGSSGPIHSRVARGRGRPAERVVLALAV